MAMALTHGGFDDDFFSGFPLSALMHGSMRGQDGTPGNRGIPLDVKETKNAFEVKADLPGVEKKDIKVNVEGDVLTISHEHAARKEDKKEDNGVKYHRVERSSAFVQRRVRLPESADMSKIKAAYTNGTLTLDIPKAEEKTRTHQINVE
jgi:HSP20 family protein